MAGRKLFIIAGIGLVVFIIHACNYSFKGTNPPEGIKTIFISNVSDQSDSGIPELAENITILLKNKFINDNTLEYADKTRADGMIVCTINRINDEAEVIQGNEQVSRRKITIFITAEFSNLRNQKVIWKKEFSNWGIYESSGGGFSERDKGLQIASDKICDDILLEVISNW
jgi:hypothetical protein